MLNPVVVVAVVLVFGVLVTLHEFGHFLVAKLNGVKVLEFNVGFGNALAKVRRGETQYALRTIPLGGYVRLAGMDDGDTGPRSFTRKPVWRRVSIIAAGAITNLLLPIPIFFAVIILLSGPVTVTSLIDKSPALRAGIPLKAEITAIDGKPVQSADELRQVVSHGGGQQVVVQYRDPSGGRLVEKNITPEVIDGGFKIGDGTS